MRFYPLLLLVLVTSCGSETLHHAADYQTITSPCTEADRTDHLYQSNHALAKQWEFCSRETWAKRHETAQCLVKAFPSLTESCAECFGEYSACSKKNCFFKCAFGSDESCKECAKTSCAETLEACTKISWDALPSI